ncbi:UNVERIFIED_CONTAM: hypothetical protein GTU68_013739, partial [Idotea baltica]|nr:hypothetical protein [Idotea baltica]
MRSRRPLKIKDVNVIRPPADRLAVKTRAEDIARLAGVSQSAVSRALSNSPGVSAKTRTRIREIAEQLDYSPNALASGLITQKSGLI